MLLCASIKIHMSNSFELHSPSDSIDAWHHSNCVPIIYGFLRMWERKIHSQIVTRKLIKVLKGRKCFYFPSPHFTWIKDIFFIKKKRIFLKGFTEMIAWLQSINMILLSFLVEKSKKCNQLKSLEISFDFTINSHQLRFSNFIHSSYSFLDIFFSTLSLLLFFLKKTLCIFSNINFAFFLLFFSILNG
jgi:hypothetical protein